MIPGDNSLNISKENGLINKCNKKENRNNNKCINKNFMPNKLYNSTEWEVCYKIDSLKLNRTYLKMWLKLIWSWIIKENKNKENKDKQSLDIKNNKSNISSKEALNKISIWTFDLYNSKNNISKLQINETSIYIDNYSTLFYI